MSDARKTLEHDYWPIVMVFVFLGTPAGGQPDANELLRAYTSTTVEGQDRVYFRSESKMQFMGVFFGRRS